jgi:hypothetical protein
MADAQALPDVRDLAEDLLAAFDELERLEPQVPAIARRRAPPSRGA